MNASIKSTLQWRKSSYSNSLAGECVELATTENSVAIRDSKDPDGPILTLAPATWHSLLRNIKNA